MASSDGYDPMQAFYQRHGPQPAANGTPPSRVFRSDRHARLFLVLHGVVLIGAVLLNVLSIADVQRDLQFPLFLGLLMLPGLSLYFLSVDDKNAKRLDAWKEGLRAWNLDDRWARAAIGGFFVIWTVMVFANWYLQSN